MKDKLPKTSANNAIDDYLNDLLIADESFACDEVYSNKPVDPIKNKNDNALAIASRVYHFDEHPSRQNKPLEITQSLNKSSDADTLEPKDRHNIERVERLLEDFNRRQKIPDKRSFEFIEQKSINLNNQTTTDIETIIASESKVLLQPTILLPEIPNIDVKQPEQPPKDVQAEEDEVKVNQAAKVWIPPDKVLLREDWSNEPFQTLLFEVAGLKLALPLLKLGGIQRIDQEITPLFGKPDWFMGLIPGHEGNINVVDTTRWVMPNKYQHAKNAGLNYQFLILLGDSNWGLACSEVNNAISLSPEKIRWRASAGKRPWLAGMLIDEMCALLDVDTLIYLLEENFPR